MSFIKTLTIAVTNPFWCDVLEFATQTTQRVGTRLLAEFGTATAVEKIDGSLVTASDQWADAELRQAIAQQFPDHGVLSEEVAHVLPETDWCWVIDPIDGTTNFSQGIPLWAISLGLLYQGTPVFGFVYVPPIQQAFHGFFAAPEQDNGAFLNGQPIRASRAEPGSNQFFSFCARSIRHYRHPFPCKVRMLGVASYNLLTVAAGISLGATEATPKIWDIAGVYPILKAAGATWQPLDGQPLFPLSPGQNYSQTIFPTLTTSQPQWVDTFLPFLQS